ncbi:pentatricopeptide repeat-containing protein At3g02490, mitochondrial-like [Nicotiana tabacum]|uniref:Pentatricopeptide repeat-containing protein At3g02490, mitochondrial-like n=1 Tax=Nicotiana tabacum TaxID=4097 RepID=A0A1S4BDZ0_TOBAC|nr:PREDICTED: pentatricopeptide repeat-containing protein At3g02490, mitochondrial-like [Nicotiana tabacum]
MRNQQRWLRLLLRHHSYSRKLINPSPFQVNHSIRSITSPTIPSRASHMLSYQRLTIRNLSTSELAVEHKDSDHHITVLTDIFSKPNRNNDEIKLDLDSNSVVMTHDLVVKALRSFNTAPDSARRFFNWVLENESERLSSKVYNYMLGILGSNGFAKEFWDMVEIMKSKGYGVSRGTFNRTIERFEKDKLSGDVKKLKEFYGPELADNSSEEVCSRVCKLIRGNVWGDDVEKQLRGLNLEFSSELITVVLEKLECESNKALIFFRWIEESGLFKHNERTINAMARVLGREESGEKFWRLVDEMKTAGFEMERETYNKVLENFVKRKMIKDAVDLYEFAMVGINKPSSQDCTFLLKKIVVSKELDLDLFSKVLRVFTESGNSLTGANLNAILKSLTSVDRFGECNNILKAMKDAGFTPSLNQQSKIAFHLGSGGKDKDLNEFMNYIDSSGDTPNSKAWTSLIEGYCEAGDLVKASDAFEMMVEKEGPSHAGYALELLVSLHCRKRRAIHAFKLVKKMVEEKELHVWHTTYKLLIGKLLAQRGFEEALDVLHLMKSQGYPPFLDPFIKYLSKTGTADDALAFTEAVTVKKFSSTSVFLNLFEAYFKAGRRSEAQDFLAKCPRYIRNHADVLNLFCSMKPQKAAATIPAAA